MAAEGLQNIPSSRIPRQWDADWFAQFIQQVLKFSDVRNAIEGPGIQITGQSDEPATLSATENLLQLLEQPYILATPSLFLPNERILEGQPGVVNIVDGGPNADINIQIAPNGIGAQQLRESTGRSVIGRNSATSGSVGDIVASADKAVLHRDGATLQFTPVDSTYVSDFSEAAQDAIGTILDGTDTIDLAYDDSGPGITGDVRTQMSIDSDASGLKLDGDAATPGNDKYYGTDGGGTKGFFDLPTGGGGSGSLVYVNTTVPAGNTVANTSTQTAFASGYTIPAGTLQVGSVIRVKLYGVYGTDAVPPGLTLRLMLGSTVMLTSGVVTQIGGIVNLGWWAEALMVVQAIGVSGSIEAQGYAELSTAAATGLSVNIENTAPIAVDTTAALAVGISAEWGTADADNTITLREMTVEIANSVAPDAAASAAATYLTEADETASLPNSRRVLPGANITFDDTTPGERTINASGGGGGSANITPDTHPTSPDAMDDEFEAGSLDAKWTWFQQGSASVNLTQGSVLLSVPASSDSDWRSFDQPISGSAWKFRMKAWFSPGTAANAGFSIRESSSGKIIGPAFISNAGPSPFTWMPYWNAYNSFNNYDDLTAASAAFNTFLQRFIQVYCEVELLSGNIIHRMSYTGEDGSFFETGSLALSTAGFSGDPDRIGLGIRSFGTPTSPLLAADWFRRLA